ncbi:MAG: HAMP domain-containing protein [Acidobacteria bacterium]|nr:HAMP domain-containing protein [Acidobacteriota bacterium]
MFAFFQLAVVILLVLLGFFVFVNDPRSRANQTFGAFIAFLAFWTTKDLVFWNFNDAAFGAGWWAAASFVTALLLQFALVIFAWVFPENNRVPHERAAIFFAPGIVFIPAALLGYLWDSVEYVDGRFDISVAPLAYFFVGYVYFLFFYGFAVLIGKYRLYSGTQRAKQLGAIILALAITGLLKTLANLVLPYFDRYELLPYSSLFVIPGVLIYAYAITNFKLLSLQTALDQFRLFPITYKIAVSIAAVAVPSFFVFQVPIAWWAFRDGMTPFAWQKYLIFSIISALVPNLLLLLMIVRSVSRPLQRITLAAIEVTNGRYGAEADLRKSNDEIGLLASSFNEMSRKMAEDLERLRRMNEQLQRADRLAAMGTLATGVAHEVNNPLASISSLIQLIRSRKDNDPETLEDLDLVAAQIERIKRVTHDLTDFSRSRPPGRAFINVRDVVNSALQLANYDASFNRLEIQTSVPAELPQILADASQLQQVLLNLFLNARDAMPQGGMLEINAESSGNSVRISVADSGSGFDEHISRNAFDPFFTTKPAGKGTGLGLAVCYGIVTAHGGTIEIRSGASGGAEIVIELPIAQ